MSLNTMDYWERANAVEPERRRAPPAALAHRPVLELLLAHINRELRSRTGEFLERAADGLCDSLAGLQDAARRNATLDAQRWLISNKDRLQQLLYERMSKALTAPLAASPPVDHVELELLSEVELKLTLARARLVHKVMDQGKHEVAALRARFETLREAGVNIDPAALAPDQLADGFMSAIAALNGPAPVQERLMDVYGDRGVAALLEFYQGVNHLLAERDILPKFRIGDGKAGHVFRDTKPARQTPSLRERMGEAQAESPLSDWRPGQLRELLEQPAANAGSTATAPVLSPAQVQQIDHVEAFFLSIPRDARISDRVRNELNRVILTIMTIPDPEKFSIPDHPVRAFVRQLTVLGYRDQESPLREFDMIQALVGRIVSEQGQDIDSFYSGAEALYTLARRAVKRLKDPRAEPAPESRQPALSSAVEARQQVLLELREHAAGTVLPLPAQEFVLRLLGPWMMVRYQRYGEQSQPGAEARAFASLFFDALRPAVDAKEQLRKRALRRQTLQHARARTERSRVPADDAIALLTWLEHHLAGMDKCLDAAPLREGPQPDTCFLDALPVTPLN